MYVRPQFIRVLGIGYEVNVQIRCHDLSAEEGAQRQIRPIQLSIEVDAQVQRRTTCDDMSDQSFFCPGLRIPDVEHVRECREDGLNATAGTMKLSPFPARNVML